MPRIRLRAPFFRTATKSGRGATGLCDWLCLDWTHAPHPDLATRISLPTPLQIKSWRWPLWAEMTSKGVAKHCLRLESAS